MEPLRTVAAATQEGGGHEAVQLRVAEAHIDRFGELAKETYTMILSANVADVAGMIATAMMVIEKGRPSGP